MSDSLTDIAQQLKDNNKIVQLIYAFNGTGKTKSQGGGVPFSIMNPYRVVHYIQYVG